MASQQITITAQPTDVTNFTSAFATAYPNVTGLTTQQQVVYLLKDFITTQLRTQSVQTAQSTYSSSVNSIVPPTITLI